MSGPEAPASFRWTSDSPAATSALAARLGTLATANLTIGLVGNLGAGKTCFIRGLASGLGVVDPAAVASPTYVLVHEYEGRLPLFHFDVYRLSAPEQFAALGPEEYFFGGGVTVVEWADRVVEHLPIERIDIVIEHAGEAQRDFRATAFGPAAAGLLRQWQAALTAGA